MEPNVVAVGVDVVLQQQIQAASLPVLEDAVQVASFEVRRKGERRCWACLLQIVEGNNLIVSDSVADVSNQD